MSEIEGFEMLLGVNIDHVATLRNARGGFEPDLIECAMICQKDGKAKVLEDKWSVVSNDGLRGSHYEHTVAVVDGRAEILSLS